MGLQKMRCSAAVYQRSWVKRDGRGAIGLAAIASAVLAASVSFGQVAPVQNGHALDMNPNVGSGGSNQPVPGYVPINGNEVITGNVAGLGYFHGNIPYRSPYEFAAPLGSSALNNFSRQSAGNTMTYAGSNQAAQSYYLPSRLVSSQGGQINATAAQAGNNGFSSSLVGRYVINPTSPTRRDASPTLQVMPAGSELPVRDYSRLSNEYVSPTNEGVTQASPLFGLRVALQPESRVGVATDVPTPRATEGNPINPNSVNQNALVPNATTNPGEVPTGRENPGATTQPVRTDNGVGRLIQGGVRDGVRNDQVVGAPGVEPVNAFVGQTNKVEPDATVGTTGLYASLQLQLDSAQKQGLGATTMPSTTAPGRSVSGGATGRPELDPVTGQLISPLEQKYQSDNPGAANYRPKEFMKELAAPKITAALQAGREVKPLQTLTTPTLTTPFETLMVTAEKQLKDGDYFASADTYQRAIIASNDNALPMVGRAHAELAGGMYLSAAYDLEYLFDRKPELVAVHYDLGAFLSPKRIEFLKKDLGGLVTKKETNSASFLLSYLEYQQGELPALRETLDAWSKRDPKDRWPEVLNRAWLAPKGQ